MKVNQDNFIRQLQHHNEDALAYVIDVYGALLMAVIRKHLYALPQFQEECMNDVLLAIWQHIDSYDESKSSFRTWIAAIARFRSIDYLRKYKNELEKTSWEELNADMPDMQLREMPQQEYSKEVYAMLQCLSPTDRELFWRLYVNEETVDEVSEALHLKKSAVYNRVSRARKKLIHFRSLKGDV